MTDPATVGDPPRPVRSKATRRWFRFGLAVTTWLLVVGPWPGDDSQFSGTDYQGRTLNRLKSAPGSGPAGPIRVGVAEVDISPGSARPLAGFIGQIRTPFVGVDSRCFARALTVESASSQLTLLTSDLLLINDRLAQAVVERSGVRPDQIYFTASHTHGGPGGWGDHPLEMLVAGAYDPAFFNVLADQLAGVVRQSRTGLEPAEMGFVQVQAPGRQKNRVEPSMPTHDALSALVFRSLGSGPDSPPIAILAVFGAHATVSHPVPPRLGGDYPSALVSELKRSTGARVVLFASGAVGDASPARIPAASSFQSAQALGIALAGDLKAALSSEQFESQVVVGKLRLVVDLPVVRLPFFSQWLRFSPALTWWIVDRQTHLHAVRLGPAVLVGFPGDYSGHLADALAGPTRESGLSSVATSFNGDYRGYLVSESVFRRRDCYETRWMSFHGPWSGDYLTDLAIRMTRHLGSEPTRAIEVEPDQTDLAARVALLVLLAGFWVRGPNFRELRDWFGSIAVWLTLGMIVGFVLNPDLVAWSKLGFPGWLRLLGLPLGILGLMVRKPGRTTLLLAVGSGLLASSWVVFLMVARAWVVGRIRTLDDHQS